MKPVDYSVVLEVMKNDRDAYRRTMILESHAGVGYKRVDWQPAANKYYFEALKRGQLTSSEHDTLEAAFQEWERFYLPKQPRL